MKNVLFIAFQAIGICLLQAQSPVDTLTNAKIIQLSKVGLPPTVLISKIQASICMFDVSTDGLIHLSTSGVASEVINEMMKSDAAHKTTLAEKKDMRDPKTKRATGIYYYNPLDSLNPLKRVDPNVTSTNKSGGFGSAFARSMTYGLASDKITSSLSGANSRLKINNDAPVFYFYFDNQTSVGRDNWFFASATSPNEFVLVKLTEKNNSREMAVGSANSYGSSTGISNKAKVDFEYLEEAAGIYKVTFKEPLSKGEYCFVYASATPTSYSNDKVFDFSIQIETQSSSIGKASKRKH